MPTSIVSKVVDDLLKYGEVQRALLGAEIREIDADFAKEKGLKTLNGLASEVGVKKASATGQKLFLLHFFSVILFRPGRRLSGHQNTLHPAKPLHHYSLSGTLLHQLALLPGAYRCG